MYEWDEEEKKVEFSHNPFSMPQGGLEALVSKDPLAIKAFQYDVACNGYELASGGMYHMRDWPPALNMLPADALVPMVPSADDILVLVAGGAGKHSAVLPSFGATVSVSREIPGV